MLPVNRCSGKSGPGKSGSDCIGIYRPGQDFIVWRQTYVNSKLIWSDEYIDESVKFGLFSLDVKRCLVTCQLHWLRNLAANFSTSLKCHNLKYSSFYNSSLGRPTGALGRGLSRFFIGNHTSYLLNFLCETHDCIWFLTLYGAFSVDLNIFHLHQNLRLTQSVCETGDICDIKITFSAEFWLLDWYLYQLRRHYG